MAPCLVVYEWYVYGIDCFIDIKDYARLPAVMGVWG